MLSELSLLVSTCLGLWASLAFEGTVSLGLIFFFGWSFYGCSLSEQVELC